MLAFDRLLSMNRYNSFGDSSQHRHTSRTSSTSLSKGISNDESVQTPRVYSTPAVSAALISAFGLPTLIELETGNISSRVEEAAPAPSSPQFTSVGARNRSFSLPGGRRQPQQPQQEERRARSRSYVSPDIATLAPSINAYTYRVRRNLDTIGIHSLDEHRLRLTQNPDGTYSHATRMNNEETKTSNGGASEYDADDIAEADTGLLMTTDEYNLKASVSLDTVTHLKDALMNMDELPPHYHPSIPQEMLDPPFTQTAPPLKLWPLAVLVFYNVSGGPFGIEPTIRAGGNFYAILGFIVFPFIWSIPEALVTAELGSAFQDPSAGVAWVEEAFGGTLGSLCGYLAWISGATDNAIYPTLFVEYLSSVAGWGEDFSGWTRFGSVAAITLCLAALNYTGLEIVGNASLVVCVIAMSPFILMVFIGAPQVDPTRWFQMPDLPEDGTELFDDDFQTSAGPLPLLGLGGILWRPYLNNLFWNLNSFDSVGSFAGETSSVSTTYPRGIFIGLVMCIFAYIIPLLIAVGATDYSQSAWKDGQLGKVALDIGGPWLGGWTIFAAGISNLALFLAEMSSDAFQLMGMGERGFLPKIFTARSKYGTPTTGILFNTLVVVTFSCADFGQLLELLNCVYAISLLLEYAAFVKLRLFHKELHRPYRIPIPDYLAFLVVLPPTLGILFVLAISNWYVYFFCFGSILFGICISRLSELAKERGWFEFVPTQEYAMPPLSADDKTEPTEDNRTEPNIWLCNKTTPREIS